MYTDQTLEFEKVETSNGTFRDEIILFLKNNGLGIDGDIEQFVVARCRRQLVACAGLAGNTLKCIAVAREWRGTALGLKIIHEAELQAVQNGEHQLFLLTCPDNVRSFQGCGFYPLVTLDNRATLMENSPVGIHRYCRQLRGQHLVTAGNIGGIVMNANPFTLGHQYLIEQAAKACDWLHVFVVEEDLSTFSFRQRFAMVQEGSRHLPNITVHPGSKYIISRGTFPGYFLKEKQIINEVYAAIDLLMFRRYIAPALNINQRFVGTEPICKVTAQYNDAMHHWLEDEMTIPAASIKVNEIQRMTDMNNLPISASAVRKLLSHEDMHAVESMVPATTMPYLYKWLSANQSKQPDLNMVDA
ncbi:MULTISPECIES: [citrate (pro-3S)-lyase] ligase [Klebsiella]|uniref:[Citrate [pro-3S]-lyase] ligase n=5 Tax=Klebsiella michiganensis TaxID=1134687 RepID=A0A7H5A5Q6_9ENTR|nr:MULTISPECIES: [citrate (pro-3S)-lyase] ligase [Klebsiella]EHT01276.1 [citrate (Pro-3S)-lyase] ligase [Klebsiella michiganensis]EWF86056.1 [citrate (Pro-3S)-lyase] ligase [Klebsiella michiganensis]MBE0136335.1 [citrate (pro-3S)-lyase] ligase [Klebsiella michiganensis]MBE0204782.1 [citrate (pro-3S)-lyase] ligase [Klebsiella michiganensis]MBX4642855.1 [citrate (pro-3S)-lyase] ligase [Klebsiella michiganensis]